MANKKPSVIIICKVYFVYNYDLHFKTQFCLLKIITVAPSALRNLFRMTPQCIFSEKLITSDYVKAFLMQLITLHPIFLKVAFKQNLVDCICLKPLKQINVQNQQHHWISCRFNSKSTKNMLRRFKPFLDKAMQQSVVESTVSTNFRANRPDFCWKCAFSEIFPYQNIRWNYSISSSDSLPRFQMQSSVIRKKGKS